MTILVPDYLQTKTYSAKRDRRVQQAEVMQEGIVDKGHFAVAQRGAGANMSVDVAAGEAWVKGDSSVEQGMYHVVNDATVNVTISAASAVNPRIDTLVLAVNDSTEIGGSDEFKLEVLAGTVSAGATLANLTGVAAVGNTKLVLAYILVGKEVTSITTEKIGGLRAPRAGLTGYPAVSEPKAVAGAPAQYAHGRPLSYVPYARAYNNANQTPGAGADLLFNSESFDNDELHSTVTNTGRFTCRTPGMYAFQNTIFYGIITTMTFEVVSGALTTSALITGTPASAYSSSAGVCYLGYGDYLHVIMAGSATASANSPGQPSMSICWQGP